MLLRMPDLVFNKIMEYSGKVRASTHLAISVFSTRTISVLLVADFLVETVSMNDDVMLYVAFNAQHC